MERGEKINRKRPRGRRPTSGMWIAIGGAALAVSCNSDARECPPIASDSIKLVVIDAVSGASVCEVTAKMLHASSAVDYSFVNTGDCGVPRGIVVPVALQRSP
jgi:hypothetical protein